MKKLYVVHATNTAIPSGGFVGVFEGRDMACRVAREESRNGREAAVIRQSDAVTVAAFHTGVSMPVEDVYLNYPAVWPELYGVDRETLAAKGWDLTVPTCRHCDRAITRHGGQWIDPAATGDEAVWRETCDSHDTFEANHEPNYAPFTRDEVTA